MSKVWPSLPPLPSPGVPVIEPNGLPQRDWYQWMQRVDLTLRNLHLLGLGDLQGVDLTTPPTDGQQLTYIDADAAWKPGDA